MTREPTEMELRVAKALIATVRLQWDAVPESHPILLAEARAAIRAMREPTDEMMNRGTSTILIEHMTRPTKAAGNFVQFPASTSHDVWTAMIDAASPQEE